MAALLAKIIYFDFLLDAKTHFSSYLGIGILAAMLMILVARQLDLHSIRAIVEGQARLDLVFAAFNLSVLLLLCLLYLFRISDHFSRGWFAFWYLLSVSLLFIERTAILLWARRLQVQSRLLQRVAVYGEPQLVERVIESLFVKDRNLVLAGAFSDDPYRRARGVAISGGLNTLVRIAQLGWCDRIILAMDSRAPEKLRGVLANLEVLALHVQLSPDAMTLPPGIEGSEEASGLVLLDVQRPPLSERSILVKTLMDYLLGAAALVAFAPLMLVIAIAIKLDSRGPVFFVQSRNGYNQRVIRVIKFRTMTVNEDGPIVTQAIRGDRRITRVGRFLRRTSLDELPQLFNVMRGELSLVGPRPHAVTHNEAYGRILSRYASRHKVKPGITGWAQVNGFRGETKTPEAMRQRLEFDLEYIRRWSLWLDMRILARTMLVPFLDTQAY